jgi:hypothetical protein
MWSAAPCLSPLLWCAQCTLPPLLHVVFSSLFIIQVFVCVCVGWGVRLSRGLCWLTPGVAVGIPCAAYLLTCWPASPKQIWSWCLVAWEPSCFLSVIWHGEALYRLGIQGVRVLLLLGVFPARCVSSISARFLIHRAHAVCFLPLVVILDPPLEFLFKKIIISEGENHHHRLQVKLSSFSSSPGSRTQ